MMAVWRDGDEYTVRARVPAKDERARTGRALEEGLRVRILPWAFAILFGVVLVRVGIAICAAAKGCR